jgi:hypothetical protein
MKQALHIFRKDTRLNWIEILATLTATAMFVWIYPRGWGASPTMNVWPWVPAAVTALVPVSWLVLITRVIHADSLVGQRQFWITRPYRWPQLAGAKVLFIAAFIYVPFFSAQCMLLRIAGMHPLTHLTGLLFNLLLVTGIAVLPMACLAAVTSNFARMLLGLLCVLLFGGGIGYLSSLLPTSSTTSSLSDVLGFMGPVSVFIFVLLIQYARRWTSFARASLVVLAVIIALFGLFGPEDAPMAIAYPRTTNATEPRFAFKQVSSTNPPYLSRQEREVTLIFPLAVAGVAHDSAVWIDNAKVVLVTASGVRWSSHWQGEYAKWAPGQMDGAVSLRVNRAFYEQTKDQPVTVELSLAVTTIKPAQVARLTLPDKDFELPGGSICRRWGVWGNSISCLAPLKQPPLMQVEARFTTEDCSATPPSNDGDAGVGWIGTLDAQPADFGLTSVWESFVEFERFSSARSLERQHLCPGSQISVTPYQVASHHQQTIVSQPLDMKKLGSYSLPKEASPSADQD